MQMRPCNDPFPDLVAINQPKRSGDSCGDKFTALKKLCPFPLQGNIRSLRPAELKQRAPWVCEGL